jgi:hypothetical protein
VLEQQVGVLQVGVGVHGADFEQLEEASKQARKEGEQHEQRKQRAVSDMLFANLLSPFSAFHCDLSKLTA